MTLYSTHKINWNKNAFQYDAYCPRWWLLLDISPGWPGGLYEGRSNPPGWWPLHWIETPSGEEPLLERDPSPRKEHGTRQSNKKWHHTPPVDRMTHACENITFPQLGRRAVIIFQLFWSGANVARSEKQEFSNSHSVTVNPLLNANVCTNELVTSGY